MKPLELHIYDKHPDADAYRVGGAYQPYCLVSADKRFRPGELAAIYWEARALGWPVLRQNVVYRFAALAEFDHE